MNLADRQEKHKRRDFHKQKGAGQGSSTSKVVAAGCDKVTILRGLLGQWPLMADQVTLIYWFKTPFLGEAESIIKLSLGFVIRV